MGKSFRNLSLGKLSRSKKMSEILHPLPSCPNPLPRDIDREMKRLASLWAKHSARPRLDRAVAKHWDQLIESWIDNPRLPLLIRKKETGIARGQVIRHKSGRKLVLTDNSSASWSCMLAFAKQKPLLKDIQGYLKRDEIPVAMVTDRAMAQSLYKCARSRALNPGILGWKVCHRQRVALRGKGTVKQRNIADLQSHFRQFLAPSNMFLVPLRLGGLGELPHFTQAIR
jgi:hypothetical protein